MDVQGKSLASSQTPWNGVGAMDIPSNRVLISQLLRVIKDVFFDFETINQAEEICLL